MLGGRADRFMIPSVKRLVLLFSRKKCLFCFWTTQQQHFSTILASFSTAMLPLLHIEFQENHRERRGRERERERATLELELARNRPEPSVPIRKKFLVPREGFTCGFQRVSFCVTRIYLACAAWSFSGEAIVWQFRVLCNYYFRLHNIKFA